MRKFFLKGISFAAVFLAGGIFIGHLMFWEGWETGTIWQKETTAQLERVGGKNYSKASATVSETIRWEDAKKEEKSVIGYVMETLSWGYLQPGLLALFFLVLAWAFWLAAPAEREEQP